jgi:hypothetical protein
MATSNSHFGMPLPRILAGCGPSWIMGSHEPLTALTLSSGFLPCRTQCQSTLVKLNKGEKPEGNVQSPFAPELFMARSW